MPKENMKEPRKANAFKSNSEKEIAWHEAGHAVCGYLFYSVNHITMEPGELLGSPTSGSTGVVLPENMYLGGAENEDKFDEYLKVIICLLSGRYFQFLVAGNDDRAGAYHDEEYLDLYLYDEHNQHYTALAGNAHTITKAFCDDPIVFEMVSVLSKKLVEKRTMNGAEITAILGSFAFEPNKLLKKLRDKYYPSFVNSFSPKLSN